GGDSGRSPRRSLAFEGTAQRRRHRSSMTLASGRPARQKQRGRPLLWTPSSAKNTRRRPTLPGGLPPSTIGAGGLNCRVRNGNGCDSAAMATGTLLSTRGTPRELHSEHEQVRPKPSAY